MAHRRHSSTGRATSDPSQARRTARSSPGASRRLTVEGGPLSQLNGYPLTRVQRGDARVGNRGGRVAVPRARTGRLAYADAFHPLIQLGLVGGTKSLLEVVRYVVGSQAILAQDHRATVAEGGRAELADDLAADVVAVRQRDERFQVDDGPVSHLENDQQRVGQIRLAAEGPAWLQDARGSDLLIHQPAHQVDLVDSGVRDRHVTAVVGGYVRI